MRDTNCNNHTPAEFAAKGRASNYMGFTSSFENLELRRLFVDHHGAFEALKIHELSK